MTEMKVKQLQQLQTIDIRTVDKNLLVDINEVQIPDNLSGTDKAEYFLENIRNPYCYKQGEYVVKVNFNQQGGNITGKLKDYISKRASCIAE